jgi:hypothetical protein
MSAPVPVTVTLIIEPVIFTAAALVVSVAVQTGTAV